MVTMRRSEKDKEKRVVKFYQNLNQESENDNTGRGVEMYQEESPGKNNIDKWYKQYPPLVWDICKRGTTKTMKNIEEFIKLIAEHGASRVLIAAGITIPISYLIRIPSEHWEYNVALLLGSISMILAGAFIRISEMHHKIFSGRTILLRCQSCSHVIGNINDINRKDNQDTQKDIIGIKNKIQTDIDNNSQLIFRCENCGSYNILI